MLPRTESTSTFSICHARMLDGAVALLQVSLDDLVIEKLSRTEHSKLYEECGTEFIYVKLSELHMFLTCCGV